jgi:hypothetical protein
MYQFLKITKESVVLYFRPLVWLWQLAFGKKVYEKPRIDRNKTTKHYQDFKRYRQGESKDEGIVFESENNILLGYIIKTRKSPFDGDDDKKEAEKFLEENRVELRMNHKGDK